jgi:hypothetical protein
MTDTESDAHARSLEDDYEAAMQARYEGAGDPGTPPGEHESWCVHRIGSPHPGADCGTCDRGDCDDVEEVQR